MRLNDPLFSKIDGEPVTGMAPPVLRVEGPYPLTQVQFSQVAHLYKLFRDAVRVSIQGFLVQHHRLPDGTRVRLESRNGVDTVTAWPPVVGGHVVIPRVYSGVVRDGQLVDVPPMVLRDFQPTDQCWRYPLGKSAAVPTGAFSDTKQLAVPRVVGGGAGDSKYNSAVSTVDVQPSLFSGRMCKVVQVILGYGQESREVAFKTRVPYDWHWSSCHGVAKADDGKAWLIEISATNGVLAMPLPLIRGSNALKASREDVLRETALLFGGLPSGETFPTGAALTAAITAGNVLQLLTTTDMAPYFEKVAFSSALGWSFNDLGTEAHNTCFLSDNGISYGGTAGNITSYHYKLAISIGAMATGRGPGDPIATASAALTLEGSGPLTWIKSITAATVWRTAMCFYEPASDMFVRMPGKAFSDASTEGIASALIAMDTPVFVCHINGVLDVLRIKSNIKSSVDTYIPSTGGPPWTHRDFAEVMTNRYAYSNAFPETRAYAHTVWDWVYAVGGGYTLTTVIDQEDQSSAVWPADARDCYAFFAPKGEHSTRVGIVYADASSAELSFSDSAPYHKISYVQSAVSPLTYTYPTSGYDPTGIWFYQEGRVNPFSVSFSTFGPNPQIAYSTHESLRTRLLSGSMISGETDVNPFKLYDYLGYV